MARLMGNREINMLEGPLLGKVFQFVLPLMLTNLLQVFFSAADMMIVGLSGVDGAIGAIGTTSALINLILNVFMGFSVGTSVVVARCIGSGSREDTGKAVHTSVVIALVSSVICMGIGLTVCRPVLILMGDEGHILELATLYTRIYFLGVPFSALTNFLIAILRAKGDTRTSLTVLTISGALNVLLNLVFVLVFHMSVDGVALATLISWGVSTVLLAQHLRNDMGWCHLSFRRLRADKRMLGDIIRVGLPAGIQGALFSLSNMLIQSSMIELNNTLCPGGSAIIDGNAAASSIEGFAYTATNAVMQAAVTFTSQNYGAKKYDRLGRVVGSCYLVTFLIATVSSLLLLALRMPLIHLYVSEPLAVDTALLRYYILLIPYFLLAFMEVGSGILRGLGRSLTSTIISLTGACLLRIVWLYTVYPLNPSVELLYLSYPITWAVTAATHFTLATVIRRKLLKNQALQSA